MLVGAQVWSQGPVQTTRAVPQRRSSSVSVFGLSLYPSPFLSPPSSLHFLLCLRFLPVPHCLIFLFYRFIISVYLSLSPFLSPLFVSLSLSSLSLLIIILSHFSLSLAFFSFMFWFGLLLSSVIVSSRFCFARCILLASFL
jgi:hypothetical protein